MEKGEAEWSVAADAVRAVVRHFGELSNGAAAQVHAAWGDQARRELRASGESSRRRDPVAPDQLTAQELQIAQLAAQGLSIRDIGQRLYLSNARSEHACITPSPSSGLLAVANLAWCSPRTDPLPWANVEHDSPASA
jgi:hypothetical protein